MRSPSAESTARAQRVIVVSLIALLLGFLLVIQLRSQAQVAARLENQDNTSVALLINDLNRANTQLLQQTIALSQRQQALEQALAAGGADTRAIEKELAVLREVSGHAGVRGPGLEIQISGAVQDFELQDALNNLRNAGAEAFALNGIRFINGTPLISRDSTLLAAGQRIAPPYLLKVIGDPERLASAADIAASSLQTHVQVSIQRKADITITELVPARPLIYAQRGA